jgi:hypothetical protein
MVQNTMPAQSQFLSDTCRTTREQVAAADAPSSSPHAWTLAGTPTPPPAPPQGSCVAEVDTVDGPHDGCVAMAMPAGVEVMVRDHPSACMTLQRACMRVEV